MSDGEGSSSGKDSKLGSDEIKVSYSSSCTPIPEKAMQVLKKLLKSIDVKGAIITSTTRSPADQAIIMYNNILSQGVEAQKKLYGTNGDKVIDEYVRLKGLKKNDEEIKKGMENKIIELGPESVSKHCGEPTTHSIFDVAPSSIPSDKKDSFAEAIKDAKENGEISNYYLPEDDPAYHLVVPL